jgi:hypothetical protein|tara:strand:- start:9455 stop:9697 length:243 start_codon:yes stop_codon:yes gene_type:complete
MTDLTFIYIASFLTVGSFLLGFVISWNLKEVYDSWTQRSDYAKALLHPEMYDADGNLSNEEMIYLRFPEEDDIMYDENEE